MTKSVPNNATRYTPNRVQAWLRKDNNRAGLWITEPRCSLAYAVSNLGGAIARLGHRIHDDAPGDYEHGQLDGQQLATMAATTRPRSTREDMRGLLRAVDLPNDDATLNRMGWKVSA
ncbi:hypothetical protein UB45_17020 [Terrabacter sp. 28]|nr:hypothetical protein UB45_17020 [Terrabacter sp. 28]